METCELHFSLQFSDNEYANSMHINRAISIYDTCNHSLQSDIICITLVKTFILVRILNELMINVHIVQHLSHRWAWLVGRACQ